MAEDFKKRFDDIDAKKAEIRKEMEAKAAGRETKLKQDQAGLKATYEKYIEPSLQSAKDELKKRQFDFTWTAAFKSSGKEESLEINGKLSRSREAEFMSGQGGGAPPPPTSARITLRAGGVCTLEDGSMPPRKLTAPEAGPALATYLYERST